MVSNRLEQIRITAHAIASQAQIDINFREKILLNPSETLTEAGLPENAISDFLRENIADVSGFVCQYTCLQTYVK